MFHLDPPPDFQGLRKDLPIEVYKRRLPHWRQDGATYFVTFRLRDALPAEKLRTIRHAKQTWEHENPPPRTVEQLKELHSLVGKESEKWLDLGYGSCLLKRSTNRAFLRTALHHFDVCREQQLKETGTGPPRFDLSSWVIMPNHVHLLVRPMDSKRWPLEKIIQSWKRQSARNINVARNIKEKVWLDESYDSIVRDAQHLWRCLQYIGRNAARANPPKSDYERWVRPDWEAIGWSFDDE